mmetsp:Transcript_30971/g.62040  ORF Transcript_30971/g.62040 Transcript_30971/m.62040 type:complete len:311 (-) Transcript_30971:368-1300(-)
MSEGTLRIHVGNLDHSITQRELESEVKQFGRPTSVWVAKNPPGFAFIEFDVLSSAEACIQGLHNVRLGQKNITVEFAKNRGRNTVPAPVAKPSSQRHRVVLKNLPHSFTWRELKDEMRRIGDVIYADVDANGDGIVEFSNEEHLAYAVRRLDGSRLDGHTIQVCREGEGGRGGASDAGGSGAASVGGGSGAGAAAIGEGVHGGGGGDYERRDRDERRERDYDDGYARPRRDEYADDRYGRPGGYGRDERGYRDDQRGHRDDRGYRGDDRGHRGDDRGRERQHDRYDDRNSYDDRNNSRREDNYDRYDRGR